MTTHDDVRCNWRFDCPDLTGTILLDEIRSEIQDSTPDEAEDFLLDVFREQRYLDRCGHPVIDYTLERIEQEATPDA